jgi:hypothetical protein
MAIPSVDYSLGIGELLTYLPPTQIPVAFCGEFDKAQGRAIRNDMMTTRYSYSYARAAKSGARGQKSRARGEK